MLKAVTVTSLALAVTVWLTAETGLTAREGDGEDPRPPAHLSETGLYADAATLRVDPRNRPYAPQYPLWTDGARKSRWVYMPPGSRIDARRTDDWVFPVGTKLWKEFAFGERRVETRLLWRASERGWVFASYVWNAAQTDAALAPDVGLQDVYEIAPGKTFSIPGIRDCRACHDARVTQVLGFSALQLSTDRDPNAPHADPVTPDMVTLRTLVEQRWLEPERRDLLENPPRIKSDNPRTRAVLGYLSANCGSCHNPESPIAPLGLLLRHSSEASDDLTEPGQASTVGRASRYEIPGAASNASRRILPGSPAQSTLLYRMRSRRPSSQMPPLGTTMVDREAVALVEQWIAEDLAPGHSAP